MENKSLNLVRWLSAIGVIIIHSEVLKNINFTAYTLISNGICRLAVPFFFITSGYFFYQKLSNHQSTYSYFHKLLKILIIFSLLELITYGPPYVLSGNWPHLILRFFTVGLSGIYWYLISLLVSLAILKPLWKRKIILPALVLGLVFYLIASSNDVYAGLFTGTMIQNIAKIHTAVFTWPQAGLASSLLFLSLGALINQYQPRIHTFFAIVPLILLLGEAYLLSSLKICLDYNCYITLIIAAPILFIALLNDPFAFISEKHSYYYRQMSLYTYMIHPFFLNIIPFLIPGLGAPVIKFTIALLATTTISYALVKHLQNP